MLGQHIVNVAEQRHLIFTDNLNYLRYLFVVFFADINRFSCTCRNPGFLNEQAFVIGRFASFAFRFFTGSFFLNGRNGLYRFFGFCFLFLLFLVFGN